MLHAHHQLKLYLEKVPEPAARHRLRLETRGHIKHENSFGRLLGFRSWFFEPKKLLFGLHRLSGYWVFVGDLAEELEFEAADCRAALCVVALNHDAELLPWEKLVLLQSYLRLGTLLCQAHKPTHFVLESRSQIDLRVLCERLIHVDLAKTTKN